MLSVTLRILITNPPAAIITMTPVANAVDMVTSPEGSSHEQRDELGETWYKCLEVPFITLRRHKPGYSKTGHIWRPRLQSVLVVQNWAITFMPRKYREIETDWFGKRGIPWHVTVAMRKRSDGKCETLTLCHIFRSCSQDSCAVLSDVLKDLKNVMPQLQYVY